MSYTKRYKKLKHIFENNMNADLISEEITTCEIHDDAENIKMEMCKRDFDVYGVNVEGSVSGYVVQSELAHGQIKDFFKSFISNDLISDSTPLKDVINILQNKNLIFILEKNNVSRIITMADLHKQPIRMLAFSLISLLEMFLGSIIKEHCTNRSWQEKLSDNRLEKAKDLFEKRVKNNEALSLLECTQISDKGTIIKNTPKFIERFDFESKRKTEKFFSNVEELRNNIAHSKVDPIVKTHI